MNILVESFPTLLIVSGVKHKIRSGFRTCLRILLAFEDNELTPQEKQSVLIENLYIKRPIDIKEAIIQASNFMNGTLASTGEENKIRLYSFSKDYNFIFSAFKSTHGIDLDSIEMHWWKFLVLFMDLGSETTFSNLVGLRSRVKSGKATKEERALARDMGEIFDIPEPDDRTLEEKETEAAFLKLVEQGANNG